MTEWNVWFKEARCTIILWDQRAVCEIKSVWCSDRSMVSQILVRVPANRYPKKVNIFSSIVLELCITPVVYILHLKCEILWYCSLMIWMSYFCCLFSGDQRSLYLKCQGVRADIAQAHWKGIQFYNTTYQPNYDPGNSLNESTSSMKFVDVLYAGKGLKVVHVLVLISLLRWPQNGKRVVPSVL